jgi:phosphoserine phosphatase RsbU/P
MASGQSYRDLYVQMYRAVEQTADSIFITDDQGIIEYVNPAFEETTGYTAAEALGCSPRILKSGKQDASYYRFVWGEIKAGRPFRGTVVNRKKSGELYWAEQTISPIRDPEGHITHFVSVLKDVTAERERQKQQIYMQLAREVQQRYYDTTVSLPGLDIAAAAFPADETGGDYFDLLPQPDGSLYVVVADVAGHGFGSAFVMAETRATLRAYATIVPEIPRLLGLVNRTLVASLGGNRYVTMLLARLDPHRRVLEYAGAGHPHGYVLKRSGDVGAVLQSTAPPLGIFENQEFTSGPPVALEEGDTILMLTDGITDAMDPCGAVLGEKGVLNYVRSQPQRRASDLVRGLYETTRSFARGERQRDDVTAIVCRVEQLPGPAPAL